MHLVNPPLDPFDVFITRDPVMRRVEQQLRGWAQNLEHALITGDSGVGKSLAARVLHMASCHSQTPFVVCRAPESDGVAHPWATIARHGGTVVLDALETWPVEAQGAAVESLLHRPISAPAVRVLGTSRASRSRLLREGRLHPDLVQPWSTRVLHIPPLRTRPDDLAPLVRIMLQRSGRSSVGLENEAWRALSAYSWPDNVRELRDLIGRALTLASGERLDVRHLIFDPLAPPALEAIADQTFGTVRTAVETWYLRRLLHQTDNNISEAARRAGCSRKVLRDRLRRYGLYVAPQRVQPPSPPPSAPPARHERLSAVREPSVLPWSGRSHEAGVVPSSETRAWEVELPPGTEIPLASAAREPSRGGPVWVCGGRAARWGRRRAGRRRATG